MRPDINIGHLHLSASIVGAHVLVTVRGAGAAGSRPLLGTLTMAPIEWSSLEMVVQLRELADRQRLSDLAEISRVQVQRDAARLEIIALAARLDRYQPIRSVLGDWAWQEIVEDGAIQSQYEPALEAAARALAELEKAEQGTAPAARQDLEVAS